MSRAPTEIVQSFWLRFWWEPHRSPSGQWRGTIWHEQQTPGEKPTAVANPQEAFEFVWRTLDHSSRLDPSASRDDAGSPPRRFPPPATTCLQPLRAFWHKLRGEPS